MRWSRSAINFTLDAFALLVLMAVLWTRIAMHVVVPLAGDGEKPVMLWGWGHGGWATLNFWLTMAFAVVILVHLIMHWTWISQFVHQRVKRYTGSRGTLDSGTQTVYGVGFMIGMLTVLGGLLLVAAVMAKPVG